MVRLHMGCYKNANMHAHAGNHCAKSTNISHYHGNMHTNTDSKCHKHFKCLLHSILCTHTYVAHRVQLITSPACVCTWQAECEGQHICYTYVTGRVWCDMCQVMGNFSLLIHLHTYGPLRLNGYMWLSIQYNDGGQCVMCAYVHTSMCPLYLYASSRFLVSRIKRLKRKTCRSSVPRNGMFDARPE